MSNPGADSDGERVAVEGGSTFMLPPESFETAILLLGISVAFTSFLHCLSITHLVGIGLLVFIAQAIGFIFNPRTIGLLMQLHKSLRETVEKNISGVGQRLLAWISGVAPEDKVQDPETGLFTEAGKQFQYRAGIIGALIVFVFVYKVVSVVYSKAYLTAEAAASIAELGCKPAKNQSKPRRSEHDTASESVEADECYNPLFGPEINGIAKHPMKLIVNENPLKLSAVPETEKNIHKACCIACEALAVAQAEWIEAVRQYDEANDAVLEDNSNLRDSAIKLQVEVCSLREEMKILYDRIEYLDVLLEEAGMQLGHEAHVKDVLWEAYCKRNKVVGADIGVKVETTASSPPHVEANGA